MARGKTFNHNGHHLTGESHGGYTRIQLKIPVTPTLVLTPKVGAFEPERFTPIEDATITRNTVGARKPDVKLRYHETGTAFDRRFTVSTSDLDFAAAVLTDEVRALLAEPWFRVHEVVWHDGALWTTEAGRLTHEKMLRNGRQLARLAAVVPGDGFGTDVDTSEEAWLGGRRRGLRDLLNRRRVARDRQPLSAFALTVRTTISLALLVPGLLLAGNALSALTGLAPETPFTVTASVPSSPSDGNCPTCGNTDLVSGTYDDRTVTDMWWMTFDPLPEAGDVVPVSVGPLWWHPVVEGTDTAVFLLLIALLPLLAGGLLAKMTYAPRRRRAG
jgi:hypothetical protein